MSRSRSADDGTTRPSQQRLDRQALAPAGRDLIAVSPALARVAARQSGVLTREQLLGYGFAVSHVRAAIDANRWQAFGRRVVVLHNAELTVAQRAWVAVLMPRTPAALAGLSAAASAGLRGFESDQVHIVVAHKSEATVPAWVRVHESRRFSAGDVVRAAGPPRVGPARALVDAATWSVAPRRACAILCAGVQQRLVDAPLLEATLRSCGRIRHVSVLRSIVGDITGGGHTLAEIDFGPLAGQAGLPRPRRQVLRKQADGRYRYLDIELDLPDGSTVAVEIDGAGHLWPERSWDDSARQNEVVIGGRAMLRFPSVVVRLSPDTVVDQLRRMRLAHLR